MRTLIHIPIIHTQADMGALKDPIRKATIEKLGRDGWARKVKTVDRLWALIRQTLERSQLPYARVRLYQDGLPQCGHEAEIVAEMARAGSLNHRLLVDLMKQGATLMGTESPDLLMQEYQLVQEGLKPRAADQVGRPDTGLRKLGHSLLEKRDRHIAARIAETLRPQETGIVLLGLLHSLEPYLAPDIKVSYPLGRPIHRSRVGHE